MNKTILAFASALLLAAPITVAFAHQEMAGMKGEHAMTGTVKDIDYKTGTLTLESKGGPALHLHFPPGQIKDVKNGDTLTVHLGFTVAGGADKK